MWPNGHVLYAVIGRQPEHLLDLGEVGIGNDKSRRRYLLQLGEPGRLAVAQAGKELYVEALLILRLRGVGGQTLLDRPKELISMVPH